MWSKAKTNKGGGVSGAGARAHGKGWGESSSTFRTPSPCASPHRPRAGLPQGAQGSQTPQGPLWGKRLRAVTKPVPGPGRTPRLSPRRGAAGWGLAPCPSRGAWHPLADPRLSDRHFLGFHGWRHLVDCWGCFPGALRAGLGRTGSESGEGGAHAWGRLWGQRLARWTSVMEPRNSAWPRQEEKAHLCPSQEEKQPRSEGCRERQRH